VHGGSWEVSNPVIRLDVEIIFNCYGVGLRKPTARTDKIRTSGCYSDVVIRVVWNRIVTFPVCAERCDLIESILVCNRQRATAIFLINLSKQEANTTEMSSPLNFKIAAYKKILAQVVYNLRAGCACVAYDVYKIT
jgi:hypothetical protein